MEYLISFKKQNMKWREHFGKFNKYKLADWREEQTMRRRWTRVLKDNSMQEELANTKYSTTKGDATTNKQRQVINSKRKEDPGCTRLHTSMLGTETDIRQREAHRQNERGRERCTKRVTQRERIKIR